MSKAPLMRSAGRHCTGLTGLRLYTRNLDKSLRAMKVNVNGQRAVRSRAARHKLERLQPPSLLITDMVIRFGLPKNGHAWAAGLKICWLIRQTPGPAFIRCGAKVKLNGFPSESQQSWLRRRKTTTQEENISTGIRVNGASSKRWSIRFR